MPAQNRLSRGYAKAIVRNPLQRRKDPKSTAPKSPAKPATTPAKPRVPSPPKSKPVAAAVATTTTTTTTAPGSRQGPIELSGSEYVPSDCSQPSESPPLLLKDRKPRATIPVNPEGYLRAVEAAVPMSWWVPSDNGSDCGEDEDEDEDEETRAGAAGSVRAARGSTPAPASAPPGTTALETDHRQLQLHQLLFDASQHEALGRLARAQFSLLQTQEAADTQLASCLALQRASMLLVQELKACISMQQAAAQREKELRSEIEELKSELMVSNARRNALEARVERDKDLNDKLRGVVKDCQGLNNKLGEAVEGERLATERAERYKADIDRLLAQIAATVPPAGNEDSSSSLPIPQVQS
ncbi:hypothetical protein FN846DRAFT_927942 [Sphaerosporella brunnea]|uniref:Uncharacterized protein n=1 Tax=Sphaerosporella brunnea TaxID=1250544 RepID=A0A5J5FA34_9PEZI|nr:hypothetical protein FN846DRAFT_927942 [Sphaerosporella brunnea]